MKKKELKSVLHQEDFNSFFFILMMEQADTGKCHGNAVFIAGFDNMVITYGTSGLCNVFNTAFVSTFNIVAEGEECI